MKRVALIIIGHFKPEWYELPEEEQAALATRIGRAARKVGVAPIVGYKLTTQGSFLQVWEAEDRAALDRFKHELDVLDQRRYYDQVLMLGERSEAWIGKMEGELNKG